MITARDFTLPSGNFRIPYEYRRSPLPPDNTRGACGQLFTYHRKFNGEIVGTTTARFFNRAHFESVLAVWNQEGESMAKTPHPIEKKIFHWSYCEA